MDYISRDDPFATINLDDEFEACAERVCLHPEMYKSGRVVGTREIEIVVSLITSWCTGSKMIS